MHVPGSAAPIFLCLILISYQALAESIDLSSEEDCRARNGIVTFSYQTGSGGTRHTCKIPDKAQEPVYVITAPPPSSAKTGSPSTPEKTDGHIPRPPPSLPPASNSAPDQAPNPFRQQQNSRHSRPAEGNPFRSDKSSATTRIRQDPKWCLNEVSRRQAFDSSFVIKLENQCNQSVFINVTGCDRVQWGGNCRVTKLSVQGRSTDEISSFQRYPTYEILY